MPKRNVADIVIILPRGEAIRNFVYSNTLREIANNVKLAALSVIPDYEVKNMITPYGSVFELKNSPEKWIVRKLRELLSTSHDRWLWSETVRRRWSLRDMRAKGLRENLNWWSVKLGCYLFANPVSLGLLSRLESKMTWWFRTTDEYAKLFRELKPSLVFNASHVHSEVAIPVVNAAKALGIPTATFIFSWDNLTSRSRIIPLYDYYLVWNNRMRDQLLKIYNSVKPEHVFVTGTPQFDFHFSNEFYWTRHDFCLQVGADPNRPIVLYSTGMPEHMKGETLIVEGLARILRDMSDFSPPQLLVRVYPKDQTGRFNELMKKLPDVLFPEIPWSPNWKTPKYQDCFLLTNMLRHSSVGINVASTVSLELCMFDKPAINVAYDPPGVENEHASYRDFYKFDHYRPVVESGAVMVAKSEIEMAEMLKRSLIQPQKNSDKRRRLIQDMFGDTLDGDSGKRVAQQLIKIAKNGFRGNIPQER